VPNADLQVATQARPIGLAAKDSHEPQAVLAVHVPEGQTLPRAVLLAVLRMGHATFYQTARKEVYSSENVIHEAMPLVP
jgi:hypothetical protein